MKADRVLAILMLAMWPFGIAGGIYLYYNNPLDPYIIRPENYPSPVGTPPGLAFDPSTRGLSVVSDVPVVAVADRGKSFKYVEVWLVAGPSLGGKARLEYRFRLSKYTSRENIHLPGAAVPRKIEKVAEDHFRETADD